jgi:nicotinamidase-related amidase
MKTLKTRFEDIVNVSEIATQVNSIKMNEILKLAGAEGLSPAAKNLERTLVIGIDFQQDFMDNGALGVPGAKGDVERFTRFIYNNMDKIAGLAASIDTHTPHQIFHPCYWRDANGNEPAPFTLISAQEVKDGKWYSLFPIQTMDYLENLEKLGKKQLCIWPYHCLQGTAGCALDNQFSNMLYFYAIAKKTTVETIVKGTYPLSEMYGIIKPEYSKKDLINVDFLNSIENYDKIVIGGEAKSHCVLESIKQILVHYGNRPEITSKIYILEDCMSIIPGYEKQTEDAFNEFKMKYKVNIVKSTDLVL